MKPKNILFDICHPAHVHLFRNLIIFLKKRGDNVTVVSRNKDITNALLDNFCIEYISLSRASNSLLGKFNEFILRTFRIIRLHHRKKFNYAFGTSVSIGWLSLLSNVKSYVFNEDDDATVPLFCRLAYPFATKICNPHGIKFRKWKKKRLFFNSYHELAYLHPDNFTPNEKILKKYGLKRHKYVIARFSALKAHHDIGAEGISDKLWGDISTALQGMKVVQTYEKNASINRTNNITEVEVEEIHHLMAFAKIVISDSQTMTIESAVLGVPAVRINTFTDRSSVLHEIEQKYKLAYAYFPHQKDEICKIIHNLLCNLDTADEWRKKRKTMLNSKSDMNRWMQKFFMQEVLESSTPLSRQNVAFIAALSEDKLIQKLIPLASLEKIAKITLFRRNRVTKQLPKNVTQVYAPRIVNFNKFIGEVVRLFQIMINGYKYDCFIGCFQQWHGVWAWIAGTVWRKPVIQLVITDVDWNLKRFFCRKAMLAADACGVRGENSKQKLRDAGYTGKIEIINNPINQLGCFNKSEKTKYDLVAVANYAEEKDYPWMMTILKKLKKDIPDFKIAICGKGVKKQLKQTVIDFNLNENIEFKGSVRPEELGEIYTASRCFISTSIIEGVPQAAIEALSYGIPSILTDVGDCSCLIRNNIEGLIVEHGNTEMMVAALSKTLTNPAKLATFSNNAKKHFAELSSKFQIETIAETWKNLL